MIFNGFSVSPVQGTSVLAEGMGLVPAAELVPVPAPGVLQLKKRELRLWWDGGTTAAKLEQPPGHLMSMRQVKLSFSSSGTWKFSVRRPICLPGASLPEPQEQPGACRRCRGGTGPLPSREESLQGDTSKNRHNAVNINNQTKTWLFEQTWKPSSFFLVEIQRKYLPTVSPFHLCFKAVFYL